MKRDTDQN